MSPIIRINSTAGQGKCDSKLELAILNYFKSFKKVYMMDTSNGPNMGMTLLPGGVYSTILCLSNVFTYVLNMTAFDLHHS